MTLSMPPIGAFYMLLICVPGFIWLTHASKTKRDAFLTGWAFGAGYFILGLYWVSVALFVDIHAWWWVLPLSAIAGPAVVALYYALIPLLAWRYRQDKTAYALMMVAGWALIEWVRGHAFTGFPWNLIGYTWHYFLPVMQANAAFGIYGLTLLTLLWALIPALEKKHSLALIASFLLVAGTGMTRLHLHPTAQLDHNTVRIIQPNIPQTQKWSPQQAGRNFRHQLSLTASATTLSQPLTFVVWPETAVTEDLTQYPEIARSISRALPHGSTGILGSLRNIDDGKQFFNSIAAIDKKAAVLGSYDKHHLVPFGEYIPFRRYLNLTPLAAGISIIGDFTHGAGITTLHLDGLPSPSPLVCYEAIFPGEVARRDNRPDWLVNVTNDAWYGNTAGPHQHFEISRVRAIEEGLPLVRAANTGISATVDPLGRIIGLKRLGETGIVDTILPQPLTLTPYAQYGDALFLLMLIALAVTGECLKRRRY